MSRLIDKLTRVAKTAPQAMGFRAGGTVTAETKILLIASLAEIGDAGSLAGAADGADAVLLHLEKTDLSARALKKITDSLPDIPWGAWLEDIGSKKAEALVDSGCDFVVFTAGSRVSALPQGDKTGKVLQVEASLSDSLLRAVNDLPADAVLVDGGSKDNTVEWRHLMLYQRMGNLMNKPLLVRVPPNITAEELKALWETGVEGVIVEAGPGQAKLKELRRAISEPTFRISKKRGKTDAFLPRMGVAESAELEQEEEEEEE